MGKRTPKPAGPELSSTLSLPVTQEHREAALHRDKDQEQEIRYISLSDIFPSPYNPRQHINQAKIAEMAISIRKFGVIQPVTVRPKKGMGGKFELVCGECRWTASSVAERSTIPSIVRDLSDDEVEDLQFAENLQRQDVHAMDEAVTFKRMIDSGRYTIPDIAAKVLKSEDFVVHRISLNNLIKEFQEDFWASKFPIGHAVQFSRLGQADQKELYNRWGKREYDTLKNVKDFIDTNISRKLSSAPFKKDDAELVPKAGACLACPKRSGSNGVLFSDYTGDDRCFDKDCFQKKMDAFLVKKVEKILDENPEIVLVEYGYHEHKLPPAIKKIADGLKVKILNYSTSQVQAYQSSGYKAAKCLMVSGNDAGQIKTMYVPGKEKKSADGKGPAKRTASDIDIEIAGIQQRHKRSIELAGEKVYGKILEAMEKHPTQKGTTVPLIEPEEIALWFIIYDIADYSVSSAIDKVLKLEGKTPEKMYESLKKMTPAQRAFLTRVVFRARYSGNYPSNDYAFIMRKMAEAYGDIPVKAFEAEHKEEADKKKLRTEKRIQDLRDEKKELSAKASKKTASKKAAPKKAGKSKAKPVVDEEEEDLDLVEGDPEDDE